MKRRPVQPHRIFGGIDKICQNRANNPNGDSKVRAGGGVGGPGAACVRGGISLDAAMGATQSAYGQTKIQNDTYLKVPNASVSQMIRWLVVSIWADIMKSPYACTSGIARPGRGLFGQS